MAEMVGRKDEQEYLDPSGKKRRRKPNLDYFKVLMQILYGDPKPSAQYSESASAPMDRDEALFVMTRMAAMRYDLEQRRRETGIREIASYGEASTSSFGDGFEGRSTVTS